MRPTEFYELLQEYRTTGPAVFVRQHINGRLYEFLRECVESNYHAVVRVVEDTLRQSGYEFGDEGIIYKPRPRLARAPRQPRAR